MRRLPFRNPWPLGLIGLTLSLAWPGALPAQWVDAQLPRRGELQVGITGQNATFDQRFTLDGTRQPLSDVFRVTLDTQLVPPLDSLDTALADLFSALGLETPEPSGLGVLRYDVLVERTNVPISLTFGVADWLAVSASVPVVKGKSFVEASLDSAVAGAGLTATAFGGDPDALLQGLSVGIAALESIVAADTLPGDRQAEATQLLADGRALEVGLGELRGLSYVPTDSGGAGRSLTAFYEELRSGFRGFELELPELSLAGPLAAEEAIGLSSGPEFGIQAPGPRSSGIKFGDIELGISLQPLNTFRRRSGRQRPRVPLRVRLEALWRLPSGDAPEPDHLMDVGTGDGQTDIELRSTLDVGFGSRIWLSLFAGYNLQMETELERLVTTPAAPIQPGAYAALVRWDPGDVLTLIAAPRFNFTRAITFSGLFIWTRRSEDSVEALGEIPAGALFTPADLVAGSEYSARIYGFAARFASTDWAGDRRSGLPAEVELRYLRTASARDGYAPRRSVWEVGLRFYPSLFR